MYHPHFGLTKNLFSDGIALDSAVYLSPQYTRLVASFKVALTSPSSVIVLTGPAGVGKTTLTSTALRASTTRLAIAWLNGTPTNASELLELVLIELGIATLRTSRIERLQLWRQFQSEMSATASRLFVVAERTEDLSAEVLRALDSLTSPDAAGNTGANVVLLGQPGLEQHLGTSALDALRQRVRLKAQLEPFTEAELQDYLRHQVSCAGGRFEAIFAPGVVASLYRHAGGVARLANNLCETALTLAATQLEKTLTVTTLANAAAMLGLDTAPPVSTAASPTPKPTAPAAPVTVAPAPRAEPIVSMPPPATVRVDVKPAARATTPGPSAATPPYAIPTPVAPAASFTVARAAPTAPPVPARAATPAPPPAAAPPAAPTSALEAASALDFDGGATEVSDASVSDFPILTDAVEVPAAAPTPPPRPAMPPPAAANPAFTAPQAPMPRPTQATPAPVRPATTAAAGSAPAPTPTPQKRLETAYSPPKAAAPPPKPAMPAAVSTPRPAAPTPIPAPPAAATPAPSAPPKAAPDEQDVLRQTQTMRALAVAKSIDDLNDSMAETLFGDAELDLMTAALASSASWDDDKPGLEPSKPEPSPQPSPPKPAAAAPAKPKPPAAAAPKPAESDDLLDLLGLSDAPLELIDDSTLPPTGPSHKTGTGR